MSTAEEEREPDETDVDVPCKEGDRVAVEYESVHANHRLVTVGHVKDVVLKGGPDEEGGWEDHLAEIYLRPENPEDLERQDRYMEEEGMTAMRRVLYEIGGTRGWHTVEIRNGARWHKASETGTETSLTVLAEDEEPPRATDNVTVGLEIQCDECMSVGVVPLTDPNPDLGTYSCHECEEEREIGEDASVVDAWPLVGRPEDIEGPGGNAGREVAEWAMSPKRWAAFRETVLKGRKATEYAEDVDVTPGTVYRHVHDAREVIKGGHNE